MSSGGEDGGGGTASTTTTRASSSSSSSSLPSYRDDDASNPPDVALRILCLHGKGGTGHDFVDRSLLPLRTMVERRLFVMNRGKNADNEDDDDDAEAGCVGDNDTNEDGGISIQWDSLTAPYALDDGGGGYSWWTMPSGVRSYNAKEVRGENRVCV
jgi:hypothetical protein